MCYSRHNIQEICAGLDRTKFDRAGFDRTRLDILLAQEGMADLCLFV
jgi:hypothetical protein